MNAQLPSRRRILDDAAQGLGSTRGPHLSIRGSRFRLVTAAEERLIPEHFLEILVVDANAHDARIYFEGAWDPTVDAPPVCFSDNGTGPSKNAISPQWPVCLTCPKNERGSAVSFNGSPTTACSKRKKIGFIMPDDEGVTVYEMQIPPGSLTNFKAYTDWLKKQMSPSQGRQCDICDVITRVEFDPNKIGVMTFTASAWADEDAPLMKKVEYIFENSLGDTAVGRNDVACDPEQVKALLAGGQRQAAIAAPVAQAAPQAPQFQLPPRQPQGQIASQGPAPAPQMTQDPVPAAPKTRTPRKPKEEAPAGASVAAPFMTSAASATPPQSAQTVSATPAGDGMEIPAFLRRTQDAPPPAASAPPRFNIGSPPAPPPAIAEALQTAMSLPTRRG